MSERKIDFHGFGSWAIMFLFWIFWMQSGWYRIDCFLKISKACDLIQAEYEKKPRP